MGTNIDTSLSAVSKQAAATAKAPAPSDTRNAPSERQGVADAASADGTVSPSSAAVTRSQSARELAEATAEISDFIQSVSRSLQISVDEELGDPVIRVLDRETEELVRQIPAEEVLEIARYLQRRGDASADEVALRGLLLDSER
jgi:flagellar protein FlaG